MIRLVLAALLCVVCSSAYACDAMRPCFANGKPLYDSAVAQDSFSGRRAVRHRESRHAHRRVPEGLARVMAEGAGRIVAHPSGCPRRAFCGCGAAVRIFGRPIRSLWLAANWFRFPRTSPAPGTVAVRRHHVFVLEHHIGGSTWMVFDANSGRGRTRIHARSIAGYVIVQPTGGA
jgi:hypothetical protein